MHDSRNASSSKTRALGEMVAVEIQNDGPGIPPEISSRIFEPFFTTKPVGKGLGLGLDSVNRIVTKHNGIVSTWNPSRAPPASRSACQSTAPRPTESLQTESLSGSSFASRFGEFKRVSICVGYDDVSQTPWLHLGALSHDHACTH